MAHKSYYEYIFWCPPWRHANDVTERCGLRYMALSCFIRKQLIAKVYSITGSESRAIFLCKWHTKASITTLDSLSGWKSSPGKIFHRNSSEARTSTWNPVQATYTAAKVTLSTERQRLQRLQTFTEAATKYYNYTENETDEERDHQLPIIQDNRIRNESDGERQRLKFTFKLIFFDTTIGSKNLQLHEEKKNAHEEYLSSGLRTADQPFDHN